jgi:hypothetical protein
MKDFDGIKESVFSCSFGVELNILADHVVDSIFHIVAHLSLHVPLVQDKLNNKLITNPLKIMNPTTITINSNNQYYFT